VPAPLGSHGRRKTALEIAHAIAFIFCRHLDGDRICANSTAETFSPRAAADSSTAVIKLHCDLAKAYSRWD